MHISHRLLSPFHRHFLVVEPLATRALLGIDRDMEAFVHAAGRNAGAAAL